MDKYTAKLAQNTRLETERLILRPISLRDAKDMFEYASDEENTYFVFHRHRSLQETESIIANGFMKKPLGEYVLELKENSKMIGTISLRVRGKNHQAELGYTLNKNYQKRGLMTEAAIELLQLGFNILHLERIFGICDVRNTGSRNLLKRIGMTYEGTLRHNRKWKNGEWADTSCYSILSGEYFE